MATWKDIDLSFLEEKNVAVVCRTKEGLSSLVAAICKEHPDSENQLRDYINVDMSQYEEIGGFAIRLRAVRDNKLYFGHCDADWYRLKGYKIIELCDITCKARDLGVLDTGHMDINVALAALF